MVPRSRHESSSLGICIILKSPSDLLPITPIDEKEERSEDERRARNIIEKKTVINLIEAFAIAVKHYLRGEEGIQYIDLYHLVKFLPSYAFPAGVIPTEFEQASNLQRTSSYRRAEAEKASQEGREVVEDGPHPSISIEPATPGGLGTDYAPAAPDDGSGAQHVSYGLPQPVTSKEGSGSKFRKPRLSFSGNLSPRSGVFNTSSDKDIMLLPASMPPKYSVMDVFPLSLFIKCLWRKGKSIEGKKAARIRAKNAVVTRNVPLEISMYLVSVKFLYGALPADPYILLQTSYVASLQQRKAIDVPTTSMSDHISKGMICGMLTTDQDLLILTVNQLTDALTGLERILTTPIPFSYVFA
jgi:ion channel-forming bestrophin family protein